MGCLCVWCEVLLNCVKDGWMYLPWQPTAWQSQEYQGALGSGRELRIIYIHPACVVSLVTRNFARHQISSSFIKKNPVVYCYANRSSLQYKYK